MKMLKKPVVDATRYNTVWESHVLKMKDQYSMPKYPFLNKGEN
jgi:hypothetical protein